MTANGSFVDTNCAKSDLPPIFRRWGVKTHVEIQSARLPSNRSFLAQQRLVIQLPRPAAVGRWMRQPHP
jgi:hypothetical protein